MAPRGRCGPARITTGSRQAAFTAPRPPKSFAASAVVRAAGVRSAPAGVRRRSPHVGRPTASDRCRLPVDRLAPNGPSASLRRAANGLTRRRHRARSGRHRRSSAAIAKRVEARCIFTVIAPGHDHPDQSDQARSSCPGYRRDRLPGVGRSAGAARSNDVAAESLHHRRYGRDSCPHPLRASRRTTARTLTAAKATSKLRSPPRPPSHRRPPPKPPP